MPSDQLPKQATERTIYPDKIMELKLKRGNLDDRRHVLENDLTAVNEAIQQIDLELKLDGQPAGIEDLYKKKILDSLHQPEKHKKEVRKQFEGEAKKGKRITEPELPPEVREELKKYFEAMNPSGVDSPYMEYGRVVDLPDGGRNFYLDLIVHYQVGLQGYGYHGLATISMEDGKVIKSEIEEGK